MFRNTKRSLVCSFAVGAALCAVGAQAAVPTIASSSSNATTLTIVGANLSGGTPTVTLGAANLAVQSQSATQLTAVLPANLVKGDYTLYVQIGSKTNSTTSIVTIGAVGPVGPAGPAGSQGPAGPAGTAGATGPQGPKGDQGTAGPAGPTGPQGIKGDTGAIGATGPQGAQGAAGPQGLNGDTGAQGSQGSVGAMGPQGAAGTQGTQGPAGPAGGSGLRLVDANGVVAGLIYGAGPAWGQGYFMTAIGTDRILIPYGWLNLNTGPEIGLGTLGMLSYESDDCSGQAYMVNDWSHYPGSTKPAVILQAGAHYRIYLAGTLAPVTIQRQSVLYPGPPGGSGSVPPECYASVVDNLKVYPAGAPIDLSWTAPFSVQ